MQPPQVFVISPLHPDGRRVQDTVQHALEEVGFRVVPYSDAIPPGAELTSKTLDNIRRADLIVADVTGQNPNVLYELGFADALRKPVILLFNIKSNHGLPSDLTGLQYIAYDLANLHDLAARVKSETKAMTLQRSA